MINLKIILAVATIIEIATLINRFAFNRSAKKFYKPFMKELGFKKVYHIHHLYTGILIGLIFYEFSPALFNFGLGIALADFTHHFVFLWILVGNPEFKVVYKNSRDFKEPKRKNKKEIKSAFKKLIQDMDFRNTGPMNLIKQVKNQQAKRYLSIFD
jgi:hypothetical protein